MGVGKTLQTFGLILSNRWTGDVPALGKCTCGQKVTLQSAKRAKDVVRCARCASVFHSEVREQFGARVVCVRC
jgi:hypothetical protein